LKAYIKRICLHGTMFLLLAAIVASCGTSRRWAAISKSSSSSGLQDELIGYSKKYLGKPYRYAGRGPYAFDCSGFTSFVFREFGHNLGASSTEQEQQFPSIEERKELRKGDLVFFEGRVRNGIVGHVGIVTEVSSGGRFRFIHASTSYGVIISSSSEPYYAARYLRGGRVLKENSPLIAQGHSKAASEEQMKQPTLLTASHAIPAGSKGSPFRVSGDNGKTVGLAQHDPFKSPPLKQHPSKAPDKDASPETIIQATLREENRILPEPFVSDMEEGDAARHTVRPGETLYSIARYYNCTTGQLRESNPHLGKVLKAGETLIIPARRDNP